MNNQQAPKHLLRFFRWFWDGTPRRPIGSTYSGEVRTDHDVSDAGPSDTADTGDWEGVATPAE